MMMALFLGLPLLLVQQLHAVEGFIPASQPPPLSYLSSFGIHGHSNHKHRHDRHFTALNIMNPKNLLADSSKLDTTIKSGEFVLFHVSEMVSLTNIIVTPPYSSVTYTMDESGRIANMHQVLGPPDQNLNEDDINEGRYYCKGSGGMPFNPFEHMNFVPETIASLSMAMLEYTKQKKLPSKWEQKLLSIEQSPSNPLGPCMIVKFLNGEDTIVLEVPLRTSYIVRNYSWMAQAHLAYLPHGEKDSPFQILHYSYERWNMEKDENGKFDSLSFAGAASKDIPDTINLPMTLVSTWAGDSLLWGWNREELIGLDAQSEVFSPRTMEYTHIFKDMDGDDPTAVSNNPILACTLTKTFSCTSREAASFSMSAIANANDKSNDFIGLYVANVGSGLWYFTFKRSDYESLGINYSAD